jgi:hypothetical protein
MVFALHFGLHSLQNALHAYILQCFLQIKNQPITNTLRVPPILISNLLIIHLRQWRIDEIHNFYAGLLMISITAECLTKQRSTLFAT